ncbi:hypothetical protein CYMTET_32282 [Cymbomonas tetramitiformis]|uniref:Uncharacterized protein n=1 Tax=Cymbomonas tetramitiformis TaxID=36881 RepID=A0AAE0FF33_9CHLO|nr:hypothetical protein CYMTET_32282 [Cymbomonas tetramitiformis]
MGDFHVGGAMHSLALNKFTDTTAAGAVAPPPTTVALVDAAPSAVSDVDRLCPMSALHAHEPDLAYADRIAQLGGLSVTAKGRACSLNHVTAAAFGGVSMGTHTTPPVGGARLGDTLTSPTFAIDTFDNTGSGSTPTPTMRQKVLTLGRMPFPNGGYGGTSKDIVPPLAHRFA